MQVVSTFYLAVREPNLIKKLYNMDLSKYDVCFCFGDNIREAFMHEISEGKCEFYFSGDDFYIDPWKMSEFFDDIKELFDPEDYVLILDYTDINTDPFLCIWYHLGDDFNDEPKEVYGGNVRDLLCQTNKIEKYMSGTKIRLSNSRREHLSKFNISTFDFAREEKKSKVNKDGDLFGKKIAITGKLTSKRTDIVEMLNNRGAMVTDTISNKVDYLIIGKSAGSKLEKAKKLGVKIIEEEAFLEKYK